MRAGRDDPCPCGSGKKYKKCCLAKDQAESSRQAEMIPPKPAAPAALARAAKAPAPPPPRDPPAERADELWEKFEAEKNSDRRAALYFEALQ